MNYVRGVRYTDRQNLISCSEYWSTYCDVNQVHFRVQFQSHLWEKQNVIKICFNWGNWEFQTIHKTSLTTLKLGMKMQSTSYKLTLLSLETQCMRVDNHRLRPILLRFCKGFLPIYRGMPPAIAEFHIRLPVNQKPKAKVIYSHQLSYAFHLES